MFGDEVRVELLPSSAKEVSAMLFARMTRVVVIAVLAWCASPAVCWAQGQSPEDKQRLADINRNVETSRSVARVSSTVAVVAFGVAFVALAWKIGRKGLGVGGDKRISG